MDTFPVEVPVMPDYLTTDYDRQQWLQNRINDLVAHLNIEHSKYENALSFSSTRRTNHENDIRIIGEALIAEAEDRGWCNDFDKWVEKVNNRLHLELPTRQREFAVTATYSVTIKQSVYAVDEDSAIEVFREEHGLDQHRWDTADFDDWDETDIEAEDV